MITRYEDLESALPELAEILQVHEDALRGYLPGNGLDITAAGKTKQDYANWAAQLPISAQGKAELAAQLFGVYQLYRLRAEESGVDQLLENEDPLPVKVSAFITRLGQFDTGNAVDTFLFKTDARQLEDNIHDIPRMPAADAAEITGLFFGISEYRRVLDAEQGNDALLAVLTDVRSVDAIKGSFGQADSRAAVDQLVQDIKNPTKNKVDILPAIRAIGVDLPVANAQYDIMFAHNQYTQMMGNVPAQSALRAQIEGRKNLVIEVLRNKDTVEETLPLVPAIQNPASDRNTIAAAMAALNLDTANAANVDAIFGENQFQRILDAGTLGPKLRGQFEARKVNIVAKIGALANPAAVDALIADVKNHATNKDGIAATMTAIGLDAANVNDIFGENQYIQALATLDNTTSLHTQLSARTNEVIAVMGAKDTVAEAAALVNAVKDTASLKDDVADAMTALGLDRGTVNDVFAENQYGRLLVEAGAGTTLHTQLTASKPQVINVLKTKSTPTSITTLVTNVTNVESDKNTIGNAMAALGLDNADANKNALFGENQHQRLLVSAGDSVLKDQLGARKDQVAAVLGTKANVAEITPLVDAVKNPMGDKAAIGAAMTALGLDAANVNGIYGENQFARITNVANNANLPDPSALRTAFNEASPDTKRQLKAGLGALANNAACDAYIANLRDAALSKIQIDASLQAAGFTDDAERVSAAKKVYAENQYRSILGLNRDGHAALQTLLESEAGKTALLAKLESDNLATPANVAVMLNRLQHGSAKNVKEALKAIGLTATEDQLQTIAEQNRATELTAVRNVSENAAAIPPAFINQHDEDKYRPTAGSLEKESHRIDAMKTFVETALHSRTAASDKAGLERVRDSVHKLSVYLETCKRTNAYYAANNLHSDPAMTYAAKSTMINEQLIKLNDIANSLQAVQGLAAGPDHIAVVGRAGTTAKVHDDAPQSPSYRNAQVELAQFFNGQAVGAGAYMALHAANQPTPAWAAGKSRSIASEIEFDHKPTLGRERVVTIKTGVIQTETKENPAAPSSYRQDFFFEPGGDVKMRKGNRQFTPPNKTPDIPADHVMKWADEAVRNFMAFADTKGKTVTINAGDMPNRCLEALAIMARVHDLKFEIRGAKLGFSYDEMTAKVGVAKNLYGQYLQTAAAVTDTNIVPPRPGR